MDNLSKLHPDPTYNAPEIQITRKEIILLRKLYNWKLILIKVAIFSAVNLHPEVLHFVYVCSANEESLQFLLCSSVVNGQFAKNHLLYRDGFLMSDPVPSFEAKLFAIFNRGWAWKWKLENEAAISWQCRRLRNEMSKQKVCSFVVKERSVKTQNMWLQIVRFKL